MEINNSKNLTAAGYNLLEPSVVQRDYVGTGENNVTLSEYITGIYTTFFAITIAAAVVTLVYYGLTYMISDISKTKANASARLKGVIIGIVIAMLSYLILDVINPDLASLLKLPLSR